MKRNPSFYFAVALLVLSLTHEGAQVEGLVCDSARKNIHAKQRKRKGQAT